MAQWKSKNKQSFWHSPLALLVILLILVIFSYNMIGLIAKERETDRNKIAELKKIEDLRHREQILQKDINKLNTNEGVEESVRDKFQVVKPGEKMVVIVDEKKDGENIESEKKHGFLAFIKRLFGR